MRCIYCGIIIFVLGSSGLFAQGSRHTFSLNGLSAFDQFSYQSINLGDNGHDEFLEDNALGFGIGYQFELSPAISLIGGIEYLKTKGFVNTAQSDYLETSNIYYSLGFQFNLESENFGFDLAYTSVYSMFNYKLNNQSFSHNEPGSGLKLGIIYSYWLSPNSGLKIGLYSYGFILGDVDFKNENPNDNYNETNLGVVSGIQVGYAFKF